MRLDSTLAFVPYGSPLSLVGATGATFGSQIIDLLGSGVGTAPANIIGRATVFGEDIGVGGGQPNPMFDVVIGTAFVTASSSTVTIQLQAAADNGSPTYAPDTWTTILQSPAYTAAQLTANRVVFRFDFPPVFPDTLRPRFYRLLFVTPTSTQFSAGTIKFALPTYVRDDLANKSAASNYTVN